MRLLRTCRVPGSGLSHAILRPTVWFGKEDLLVNNIAWMLRKLPIFGVFGDGLYRLQPIFADDPARLGVEQGESEENCIIDAIGSETFTYRGLVAQIGQIIGRPRPIISISPWFGEAAGAVLGKIVGDVIITREEIEGLMTDLLCVDLPPAGDTKPTEWAREHTETLGRRYTSELARRRNRVEAYESL